MFSKYSGEITSTHFLIFPYNSIQLLVQIFRTLSSISTYASAIFDMEDYEERT